LDSGGTYSCAACNRVGFPRKLNLHPHGNAVLIMGPYFRGAANLILPVEIQFWSCDHIPALVQAQFRRLVFRISHLHFVPTFRIPHFAFRIPHFASSPHFHCRISHARLRVHRHYQPKDFGHMFMLLQGRVANQVQGSSKIRRIPEC
jgi:hypothetical protein